MDPKRDVILHKRAKRLADEHGVTIEQAYAALDQHPIEVDRDKFLRRTLAMELLELDSLAAAFHDKAIVDRDTASGALLVKIAERRATLLGLNPVTGHAVSIVQHPPAHQSTGTDRIREALDRIIAKRPGNGALSPPSPPDQPEN